MPLVFRVLAQTTQMTKQYQRKSWQTKTETTKLRTTKQNWDATGTKTVEIAQVFNIKLLVYWVKRNGSALRLPTSV